MAAKKMTDPNKVLEPTPVDNTPAVKREAGYHVKQGCSVISRKRGVLSCEDGKLDPAWFSGGEDTVKKLVKSGQIEKV